MMLLEHRGRRPTVAPSAYIAPNAVLCGDVTVGDDARVLFGAVLTAEDGRVEVGERSVIMENALVRGRSGHPARIGNRVLVGPHAHVNGATISDQAFLATGVSVFPGARIGHGVEVRINAVVHVNAVVPDGTTVPIGWVAVGDPAQVFPPEEHDDIWAIQRESDFPGTVFGIPRDELTMKKVTDRYVQLFGAHRDDHPLD